MKKYRKNMCCFFILLLLVSISGCGTKSVNNKVEDKVVNIETKGEEPTLLVYCGAGLKKPMNEIANIFGDTHEVKVEYIFGGSAQLLSQIELSKKGDILIVGSEDSYNVAIDKGLVSPSQLVAYHIPIIGVPKGNPANIKSLKDMTKPGIKVILGDEKANAIGKAAQRIIKKSGLDSINDNVVAKTATVNELGVHLKMSDADVAIITKDLATQIEEIETIEIPKEVNSVETIPIGALKNSKNINFANEFVTFVSSDEGKLIFEKYGFPPVSN